MSDPIVGIDLGTSSSVIAHAAGTVPVLADDRGGKVHPSVVSVHPDALSAGRPAARRRETIWIA